MPRLRHDERDRCDMKAGTGEEKWMGGDRRDVQRGESWGEMRGRQGDWYVHCVQKKKHPLTFSFIFL